MEKPGGSRIPPPKTGMPHPPFPEPLSCDPFLRPDGHLSVDKHPHIPEATVEASSWLAGVCFCYCKPQSPAWNISPQLPRFKKGAGGTLGHRAFLERALPPLVPVQTKEVHVGGILHGRQHPVQSAGRVLVSGVGLHVSELPRCQAGCD